MWPALLISVGMAVLPLTVAGAIPEHVHTVMERTAGNNNALEGIWELPGGAMVSILGTGRGEYQVRAVRSCHPGIMCGDLLGTAHAADASGRICNLDMCTDLDKYGKPCKTKKFVLEQTQDGTGNYTLRPRRKVKGDVWLLYRLLLTVRFNGARENERLRMVRVYPETPSEATPVVL